MRSTCPLEHATTGIGLWGRLNGRLGAPMETDGVRRLKEGSA